MEISVTWSPAELALWSGKGRRIESALVRALSRAGGDAVRLMHTGSMRLVRSRKRIKLQRLKKGLPVFYPKAKRTIGDLEWRMDVSGHAFRIVDFPHRATAKGVSASINTGKRTFIRSAFLATMRSGHKGVFLRALSGQHGPATKKRARKGLDQHRIGRLPIEEVFTTRISDVFRDEGFVPFIQDGARHKFNSSFRRLFALELSKIKTDPGVTGA